MTQYHVGQKVQITHKGWDGSWRFGKEITLTEKPNGYGAFQDCWGAIDSAGVRGLIEESRFQPLPTGPVVTETVTKTRIVPGVYSGVHVGDSDGESVIVSFGGLGMVFQQQSFNADQLEAAASVFSTLAKGLRDA